jgi:hypothetical protein
MVYRLDEVSDVVVSGGPSHAAKKRTVMVQKAIEQAGAQDRGVRVSQD